MKLSDKITIISGIAISIGILIAFAVIFAHTDKPLKDPLSFYQTAISQIDPNNIEYEIKLKNESVIGDETFIEESFKKVLMRYTAEGSSGYTEETYQINEEAVTIKEWFLRDTLYSNVNNEYFSTAMECDSFISRSLPFFIIDATNYETISGMKQKDGYTVTFSNPKEPESWFTESATLDSVECIAKFTKKGTLRSLEYTGAYITNQKTVKYSITTHYISPSPVIPKTNTSLFKKSVSPDIAILLEKACCLILASQTPKSLQKEFIACEAFGDEQTTEIHLAASNKQGWNSTVETKLELTNTGKSGTVNAITKKEIYSNGAYTLLINGTKTNADPSISENDVRTAFRNQLINTIILPEHIDSHTTTENAQEIIYTFKTNSSLADQFKETALTRLYGDPSILSVEAESYQTAESFCYLTFDKVTNLPKASGFIYKGIYIINDLQYFLEYSADQSYTLGE